MFALMDRSHSFKRVRTISCSSSKKKRFL